MSVGWAGQIILLISREYEPISLVQVLTPSCRWGLYPLSVHSGPSSPLMCSSVTVNSGSFFKMSHFWDIPRGPVVGNWPVSAGKMGLIPGLGSIQDAAGQSAPAWPLLKPETPQEPVFRERRHRNEKPAHRTRGQPLLIATRESLHTATKTLKKCPSLS